MPEILGLKIFIIYIVENGTTYSYISDYDILVIMSSENVIRRIGFQQTLQKEIVELGIKTTVSLIFYRYDYAFRKQIFFCDIYYENRKKDIKNYKV